MDKIKYDSDQVFALIEQNSLLVSQIEKSFEQGIVIYGAGFVGMWAYQYLNSIGAKVGYFVDRDLNKTGSKIGQALVHLPEPNVLNNIPAMLIASRHVVKQIQEEMRPYGFPALSFDGYFVIKNYERLANVRDSYLKDSKSIETFNALLITMLTGDLTSCRAMMEKDMYFGLPEFSGSFDEIFVDAGAFVGDSVERFVWENLGTFRHIYAFEPGEKQFAAMRTRVNRLAEEWAFSLDNITLVKAGLSSGSGRMRCTFVDDYPLRHGLMDLVNDEKHQENFISSEVCSLDDYLDGREVSFIKADVEGMEMLLLAGAQKTIKRFKPKMALCAYHYPSDLFEIAEFVRSLVPEYQFHLRQHAPIFGDFVLYCHVE
jgi:FkbM family methyltransferase